MVHKQEMFYKIYKSKSSQNPFKLIPTKTHEYAIRNIDNILFFNTRHNYFKNAFFPSTIIEWNNLDPTLQNSKSFVVFINSILKFIRTSPNNVFDCDNHKSIRLITRLLVGLSHLCEHKFKHNFWDCLNPICSCDLDIESTSHFLLDCPIFDDERYALASTLQELQITTVTRINELLISSRLNIIW